MGPDLEMGPKAILLLGMVLMGFYVWCYRGRSRAARWWSRPRGLLDSGYLEHLILAALPAFGLGALLGASVELIDPGGSVRTAMGFTGFIILPWMLWGILLFIPIPRWMMPRWYREMKPPKQKRDKEQKQSPIDLWGPE